MPYILNYVSICIFIVSAVFVFLKCFFLFIFILNYYQRNDCNPYQILRTPITTITTTTTTSTTTIAMTTTDIATAVPKYNILNIYLCIYYYYLHLRVILVFLRLLLLLLLRLLFLSSLS